MYHENQSLTINIKNEGQQNEIQFRLNPHLDSVNKMYRMIEEEISDIECVKVTDVKQRQIAGNTLLRCLYNDQPHEMYVNNEKIPFEFHLKSSTQQFWRVL